MAPGRRKPAKGFKLKNDLLVGDLVLAKVKGYPPWPAEISRPEDWEKVPDPKKFFVHFFGTDEIGYVAPSDIHPLTSEAKSKLLAKSIGKKVKFYALAVKQICEAFDELQQGKRKDQADRSYCGAGSPSSEEVEPDSGVDERKDTFRGNVLSQETNSRLEHCSLKHDAVGFGQAIPEDVSCLPVSMHSDTKKDLSRNNAESTEELVESQVNPLDNNGELLNDGKTLVDFIHPKISNVAESAEGLSLGKNGSPLNIEEDSSGKNILTQKVDCSSLLVSSCATYSNGEKMELTNSHQSHKVDMGLKRKSDNDPEAHIFSSAMAPSKKKNLNSEAGCPQLVDDVRETGQTKICQLGKESSNDIKSDLDVTGGQKSKRLPAKIHGEASGRGKKVVESRHKEYSECEASELKNRPRLVYVKKNMESNKVAPPLERVKRGGLEGDANESTSIRNKKNIFRSSAVYRKKVGDKTLSRSMRSDNHAGTRPRTNNISSDIAREKDVLLQTKHHGQAMEEVTDSTFTNVDSRIETHGIKSIMSQVNRDKTPVNQLPTKRRVVRLLDDDDEGSPKTPVHGGVALKASSLSCSELDRTNKEQSLIPVDESALEGLGRTENGPLKEFFPSRDHAMEMTPEIDASGDAIISVGESEHNRLSSKKARTTKTPPKMLSSSNLMDKPVKEAKKASRASVIACSKNAQKKQKIEVDKTTCTVSDDLKKSQSQLIMDKSKPYFSGETSTGSPSSGFQINGSDTLKGNTKDDFSIHHERDGKSGMPVEGRLLDIDMSMKHLIAVAQAKRQQTHLQNLDHGNLGLVSGQVDMTVGSPSNYMLGLKRQELHPQKSMFSLLSHEFPSDKHPDMAEAEATSSSEHQSAEDLPSANTEAAVAREAFEGMLETLSRTKESIGRATRLAIECAKHGIANEIVEILVQKLESGSSFRRKVDLFFLVDSITQCSHSHRGIAGASYIPAVEAALARLVRAVAPSGASARENRRQCLKVLKLWIERKIFPESLLQRYVDDVGGLTDYSCAGLLIKRPSLCERSVDDPIRDMEGMLIDEYGSNVSFPLPGLITFQAFQEDEEEDLPTSSHYQRCGSSLVEPVPSAGESKTCLVTPNDRHHRALEDVDGELEMEDVSGHSEDADHLLDLLPHQDSSCRTLKVASVKFDQFDASLNGSPPLPQESPPPTPPLPLSPPPPSPPMPPSSSPPPPLPPLPSSPYPNHELPPSPPPLFPSQFPFPPEPSAVGQQFHQHSASNECYTVPGGSQFVQMSMNAPVEVHVDAPQQPWFGSLRTSEYVNHDAYFQSQASYSIQQYQSNNAPFVQHAFHPGLPPYSQSSNFSYQATAVQQQSFMPPHLSSNPPDCPQNYGSDDKWRTMNGDPSAQNQCGVWMPEVRPASCSVQGYGISHAMPSRHDMLSHNGWRPP